MEEWRNGGNGGTEEMEEMEEPLAPLAPPASSYSGKPCLKEALNRSIWHWWKHGHLSSGGSCLPLFYLLLELLCSLFSFCIGGMLYISCEYTERSSVMCILFDCTVPS